LSGGLPRCGLTVDAIEKILSATDSFWNAKVTSSKDALDQLRRLLRVTLLAEQP